MKPNLFNTLKKLHTDTSKHSFTKEDFLEFRKVQNYDQLVVYQGYGRNVSFGLDEDLPVEVIHKNPTAEFFGYKDSFLQFGMNLIGMVLQQEKVLHINLRHPKSQIKKMYVYTEPSVPITHQFLRYHFKLEMNGFDYYPQKVERHPFTSYSTRTISDTHRPGIYYAWQNIEDNHKQTTPPDYIVIQAPVEGIIALAELFLDFGREENTVDEINLETSLYGGMEGARPGSIETRFWLPGSFAFPEENLEDISFPES